MGSIDESSADNNSDENNLSTKNLEYIQGGSYMHMNINTIDARFKISDLISQSQSDW